MLIKPEILARELPMSLKDVERLAQLGLTANEIRKVAASGLLPENSVHFHTITTAVLRCNLKELFAFPASYGTRRHYERGQLK